MYKGVNLNSTFIRWDVEESERAALLRSYSCYRTVYISIGELEKESKDKYANGIIHTTYPGITEMGYYGRENREKIKKHSGAPQFAFGGGVYSDKLFLIDDIFEWSHHRISWSEIRTAKSIIEKLRSKN